MKNPRPYNHEFFFFRVSLSIGFSTLEYLEFFFISSSAFFEDRLQCPSPFVLPACLAVNACGD